MQHYITRLAIGIYTDSITLMYLLLHYIYTYKQYRLYNTLFKISQKV